MKFNLRIDDIECRMVCSNTEGKYEIIRWEKKKDNESQEYCYVVAFMNPDKEGYDIESVGKRFFTGDIDWNTLGMVMKISIDILDTMLADSRDIES